MLPHRCIPKRVQVMAVGLALTGAISGAGLAADLPLDQQIPVELTLSEQALRDAGLRFSNAQVAAINLREEVRRCDASLEAALRDLRGLGGDNAANGISEISGINNKIKLASTLANGAEAGGVELAGVTAAMGPKLREIQRILQDCRGKQEQLALVEGQIAQAIQDMAAAGERVKAEQTPQLIFLPGQKLQFPIRLDGGAEGVELRPSLPAGTGGADSGIRYVTPKFSGFRFSEPYTPEQPPDPGYRVDLDYSVKADLTLGLELPYTLGKWSLDPDASYAEKPDESGAERTSQVEIAQLSAGSAALGALAFPSDRFFNRRGSWGQDYDDQWALKRIGFEAVQTTDLRDSLWPYVGRRVMVAVLDTGIDRGHPELAGRIAANSREIFGNKADDERNGFADDIFGWNFIGDNFDTWDDNGHGTFVAGIIAARVDNGMGIAGVNPYARILPVKVTDHRHASGSVLIAKGIRYAVDRGARVINISIGGPTLTGEEEEAIRYAISKDVLVVAAAGNTGVDTASFGPAGTGGVITVAATDRDDGRAGYSNFGQAVDIAAPGNDVLSLRAIETDMIAKADKSYKPGAAFVGGAQDYYRASGTSFAAPFVSGVASLIMAKRPDLTGAQVKRMILHSARDIDVPGVDRNTGYGLLDARAALAADPAFFIEAGIAGVSVAAGAGGQVVRVAGTADADRFADARVELGEGDAPTAWTAVGAPLAAKVQNGALADIPVGSFQGSRRWTIRVVVRHENGRAREARFVLNLG